jgi:hypothetical protein
MSRELANIIKILFVTFFLVFVWENAIAEEEVTVLEEITVTEEDTEKKDTEEEPDCE